MEFSMTRSSTGQNLSKTSPSRLGTYLATAVGSCGLATSADGAIVNIDLTNVQGNDITGLNGGVASGTKTIDNWLGANTGTLVVINNGARRGLYGPTRSYELDFAVSSFSYAKPKNFGLATIIDSSSLFSNTEFMTAFMYFSDVSPNFDAPSFMGFRFGRDNKGWNYGYLGVTWDGTNFQLLSGAYESTLNTSILAGATAVPEPSTGALAALVLGGTALGVARRRRKQEAAATTEQAV
jgi:hypothetical protein